MRTLLFLVLAPMACSKPQATAEPTPTVTASAAPTATASAPPEDPYDAIKKQPNFAAAVASTKSKMGNSTEDISEGAALLGSWSVEKMTWADAAPKLDETTFALMRKDEESERGKRLCAKGIIIEIAKVGRAFSGRLMTFPAKDVISFFAVKSTGDLVEKNEARFCGAVTGNFSYKNTGGGTTHSVQMVGMFDLPENRLLR